MPARLMDARPRDAAFAAGRGLPAGPGDPDGATQAKVPLQQVPPSWAVPWHEPTGLHPRAMGASGHPQGGEHKGHWAGGQRTVVRPSRCCPELPPGPYRSLLPSQADLRFPDFALPVPNIREPLKKSPPSPGRRLHGQRFQTGKGQRTQKNKQKQILQR